MVSFEFLNVQIYKNYFIYPEFKFLASPHFLLSSSTRNCTSIETKLRYRMARIGKHVHDLARSRTLIIRTWPDSLNEPVNCGRQLKFLPEFSMESRNTVTRGEQRHGNRSRKEVCVFILAVER